MFKAGTRRFRTLAWRFLFLLVLYALMLLLLPIVFFNGCFGLGWDALLRSPAGERVDYIADGISSQLAANDIKNWTGILNNFGSIYQVKFSIFDLSGSQVAGDAVQLPVELSSRIKTFLPPLNLGGHRHFEMMAGRRDTPFEIEVPDYVFEEPCPDAAIAPPPPGFPGLPPLPMAPLARRGPTQDAFINWLKNNSRFLVHTEDPECFWIGSKVVMSLPDLGRPVTMVLLASTDNLWKSTLLIDLKMAGLTIGIILLLSVLFWLPFIYQLTRSLADLLNATERIAEGQFDTRVESSRSDEIGRLAEAINSMAARIHSYVSGQKRLMGDISHELCSPLARLQMALEILEETAGADQQALVKDLKEEVNEMNNLVNELLAFSKAEIKGASNQIAPLLLRPLIEGIASRTGSPEKITIAVSAELRVLAEANLLDRALSNLVRNSLRYAGPDAEISIAATVHGERVVVAVRDNGPGVAPEALASLGEPFFRPEASRNRSFGGVGLGLAIVKSCVAACQGTTNIRNINPHGLEVEIILLAA